MFTSQKQTTNTNQHYNFFDSNISQSEFNKIKDGILENSAIEPQNISRILTWKRDDLVNYSKAVKNYPNEAYENLRSQVNDFVKVSHEIYAKCEQYHQAAFILKDKDPEISQVCTKTIENILNGTPETNQDEKFSNLLNYLHTAADFEQIIINYAKEGQQNNDINKVNEARNLFLKVRTAINLFTHNEGDYMREEFLNAIYDTSIYPLDMRLSNNFSSMREICEEMKLPSISKEEVFATRANLDKNILVSLARDTARDYLIPTLKKSE